VRSQRFVLMTTRIGPTSSAGRCWVIVGGRSRARRDPGDRPRAAREILSDLVSHGSPAD
jgi:hypothetical protein